MAEKKAKKKELQRIRRLRLTGFILACICVYFTVSLISYRISISSEQNSLHSIENAIEQQSLQNDDIRRIISGENSEDYIEMIAREKLGYAAVDDRIFIDLAGSQ